MGFFEKLFGKKSQPIHPEIIPDQDTDGTVDAQQEHSEDDSQQLPYGTPLQGQGASQPLSWDPDNPSKLGESEQEEEPADAEHKGYTLIGNTDSTAQSAQNVGAGYRINNTPDTAAKSAPSEETLATRAEYAKKFRPSFMHHFPKALDTVQSHMQLPYMIGSALDVSAVIEYASSNIYSRFATEPEKLAELGRAAAAKTAMALEKHIEGEGIDSFNISIGRAQTESLEKAWIVLDFYCRMLKADYIPEITALHGNITDELIARTNTPAGRAQSETYEEVLAKCARVISENKSSEEIPLLKKRLFEKLAALDRIYVIHDETFNSAFPYVGADGRLELQTSNERALALVEFLEKNGDTKVTVCEYRKEEYEKFFSMLVHYGLTLVRIDNGLTPVEADIADFFDNGEKNLTEICNRYARGMFIRELQYGYRLKAMPEDRHDSEDYRILSAAMLKCRTNGYRALAGGLVYVFNISAAKEGTTFYTRNALENAAKIMKVIGIVDESTLVSRGDGGYGIYEGDIALRTVQRKSTVPEKGYVCAFTDRSTAEKIQERYRKAGVNDSLLIMTFNELCKSCSEYGGIILDMSSYGLEIPRENFKNVAESIKANGIIVGGKELGI